MINAKIAEPRRQVLRPPRFKSSAFLSLLVIAGVALGGSHALAQGLTQSFGGFAADQNAPIAIEADKLVVNDNQKTAVFTGDVRAAQGEFKMQSKQLVVYYTGDAAPGTQAAQAAGAGGAGDQNIDRIVADGRVVVANGKNSSASGDQANFDVKAQTITISGNVILSQCGNVLKGSALVIDLKTGQSQLKNTNTGGRISAVFNRNTPKQNAAAKKPDGC